VSTVERTTMNLVAEWIGAGEITVLSGAGLSTDSGIPDFRGPDGLWTRDPSAQRMFQLDAYLADPQLRVRAWRNRAEHPAWRAQPNPGHRALVDLERAGLLHTVVTQNIDGLHQAAGHDPERVLEVHGTLRETECLGCGEHRPMVETLDRVRAGEADPPCRTCGGVIKSATISFGQSLDPQVWAGAVTAAKSCRLLLVVGSSLQVQPVAGLCEIALRTGARLVIANASPTPYDGSADAVLREPLSALLPDLLDAHVG
jgi:NAD-dependent deacetylase